MAMTKTKDEYKIIGLRLKLHGCPHGYSHITGIEPLRESDVAYSAPDADAVMNSATVGWSPKYAANWEANFGDKSKTDDVVN